MSEGHRRIPIGRHVVEFVDTGTATRMLRVPDELAHSFWECEGHTYVVRRTATNVWSLERVEAVE